MMNNHSLIPVPANELRSLAHNAAVAFKALQQRTIDAIVRCDKDDMCVHRIPVLGIPFWSHRRWTNVEEMMAQHPAIIGVMAQGAPVETLIKNFEAAAENLGEREIMVTIGDYSVLKTIAER